MKKIAFLLPGTDYSFRTKENIPVGGYKVVYEYANRLARDGYDVSLIYPRILFYNEPIIKLLYSVALFYFLKFTKRQKAGEWFDLDKRVKKVFCLKLSRPWLKLPSDTKAIATAYQTAVELHRMRYMANRNKFYFIQDYEIWADSEEKVKESYRFGMNNITIAPWLQDLILQAGAKASVVMNAFDFQVFRLTNPIESRNKYEVVMLNHTHVHKRCEDTFTALKLVKEKNPLLHVTLFGACNRPKELPEWFTYYKLPPQNLLCEIYNNASIYAAASDTEGFALTPGEAMICGCAVACTDIGGFRCISKHNETALLSPVYDVVSLASNIDKLIHDDELRIRIAKQGNTYIKSFTWDKSYPQFKAHINLDSDCLIS